KGFGSRTSFYEWGAEIQHQLRPGFTVNASYAHNWVRGFTVTDNTETVPSDFSPYCITAPLDSRLPNGGGYPVCGLWDVATALNGKSTNVVKKAAPYVD